MRAIRLDMLDRLEQELDAAATSGATADAAIPKLVSLLGCDRATLDAILISLGWNRVEVANAELQTVVLRHSAGTPRARKHHRSKQRIQPVRMDSPFAGLASLIGGKR
jgi:ATP-dependent RNA helicase SUPV3L1/SUV3